MGKKQQQKLRYVIAATKDGKRTLKPTRHTEKIEFVWMEMVGEKRGSNNNTTVNRGGDVLLIFCVCLYSLVFNIDWLI